MMALFALYNLYTHWHIIFSLLNRDMQVYRMTLNIIEDHEPAFWAKDHKQRIEWSGWISTIIHSLTKKAI